MQITDATTIDRYYHALLERAPDHVGVFFVGVRTTGVFCIATCRARKPKRENVVFYRDFKSALAAGYRPCRVCRPTENAHDAPEIVTRALELLRASPAARLGDAQLRNQGIPPETVRRWFLRHYGMTFQAFQRMQRINIAMQEMKTGRSATEAALSSGYESLSGFGHTHRRLTGASPGKRVQSILLHRFTTPLGPMFVAATGEGVCLLEFVDRRMLETEFKDLQHLLGAQILAGENAHTRQAEAEIAEYFAGQRHAFDVALDMPGSAFRREAWLRLRELPYGATTSYQAQAQLLGRPTAVRAVAAANGANRIAIVVPCHRVVGKDGGLVGYGGGLARKQWLLEHEQRHAPSNA